jgi:hypothetical protein
LTLPLSLSTVAILIDKVINGESIHSDLTESGPSGEDS